MTESDIRIEHIKVKDLVPFAERVIGAAKAGQFVPISMQRAEAHAHNPYAAKEDVALLVAIDADEEVVGYFGILPLLLRHGSDYHKVHWFTTWNVSSKVRGRGVGADLMTEALTLGHDFLIVGSVHARRVCRKNGFWEREPLMYYWLDPSGMSQLNPFIWLRRGTRKFLRLFKSKKEIEINSPLTESFSNWAAPRTQRWFAPRLDALAAQLSEGFHFQEVDQIHAEPHKAPHRPETELHRGVEAVNWMLDYPWVVESGQSSTEQMDYYFSDARPLYRQIAVEVYTADDKYVGFVVFSVSGKGEKIALKTRDIRFSQPSYERAVLALALRYGREYQASTIELPAEIAAHLPPHLARQLLQRKERIYQCMPKTEDSPLAQLWSEITFHLWDGDMAFS
ncbi:MAG: GNAT family N-acetyltransferase [Anaerolineales bacterium]